MADDTPDLLPADAYIQQADLHLWLPYSRSQIKRIILYDPTFPAAVWFGARKKCFLKHKVIAWVDACGGEKPPRLNAPMRKAKPKLVAANAA